MYKIHTSLHDIVLHVQRKSYIALSQTCFWILHVTWMTFIVEILCICYLSFPNACIRHIVSWWILLCTVVPAVNDHCHERIPGLCDHISDGTAIYILCNFTCHLRPPYVTTFEWRKRWLVRCTAGTKYCKITCIPSHHMGFRSLLFRWA